jgi:hypothetical protein
MMDTNWPRFLAIVSIFIYLAVFLMACGAQTHISTNPFPTLTPPATLTETSTYTSLPLLVFPTPTLDCVDGLNFVSDVTIPDGTIIPAGSLLDKQWLVQNSGTCNWDKRYSLRFISGDPLGVAGEQALYPARAGTQASIQITFQAPSQSGDYISEWQAFDGSGIPFGDSFFIKITVSP